MMRLIKCAPHLALAVLWCGGLLLVLWKFAGLRPGAFHLPSVTQPALIAAAVAAYAASLFVRGERWRAALPDAGLSLGTFTRIATLHAFWVNVLPVRSGELSFPHLVRAHGGVAYARSLGVLYVVRLYDAAIIALYGVLALSLAPLPVEALGGQLWRAVLIGTASLCAVFLLASAPVFRLLSPLAPRLVPAGWRPRVIGKLEEIGASVEACNARHMLMPLMGLTALSQGLICSIYWLILNALGLSFPFGRALFVGSVVEAFSSLPIHGLLSLGSQEAVWVVTLGLERVPAVQAVGLGLCVHASFLAMSSVAAAVSGLWRKA